MRADFWGGGSDSWGETRGTKVEGRRPKVDAERSTFNVQRSRAVISNRKLFCFRGRTRVSPGGAAEYATLPHLILICGHYEAWTSG